ncbi:MAG: SMP-30/gluconolactonase/LRE family protein [Pirellulales bacterium]
MWLRNKESCSMSCSCNRLIAAMLVGMSMVSISLAEGLSEIGPISEIKQVEGEYQFTEGPTADSQGNLFFTDIPASRIYRLDTQGKVSTFVGDSGHANGLMLDKNGILFACQMDGQLVSYDGNGKPIKVLAKKHENKRFNAPNDLVLDKAGGIYFTDPRYRAPLPWPQVKEAVYYVNAQGNITRLVDDLQAPNGVLLSPDEKTLYVIPSMQKQMMAYPVESPGKLGKGKVLCELQQKEKDGNSGGDGLTIDTLGNLYITSSLGIQVVSPAGEHLGTIPFPQHPANVTFGGKQRTTLFVTARTGVYSVEMKAQGHVFTGP